MQPQLSIEGSVLWAGEIQFGHGCVMGNPELLLPSKSREGVEQEQGFRAGF